MLKNTKIWIKMSLGIGLLLSLTVLLGGMSTRVLLGVDKELFAVRDVYTPLQRLAADVRFQTMRVPANMNEYLLTGNAESWKHVEETLAAGGGRLEALQAHIDAHPGSAGTERTAKGPRGVPEAGKCGAGGPCRQ